MPITATAVLGVSDMACLVLGAPCQLRLLAGQEHGRTISLTDIYSIPSPVHLCENIGVMP